MKKAKEYSNEFIAVLASNPASDKFFAETVAKLYNDLLDDNKQLIDIRKATKEESIVSCLLETNQKANSIARQTGLLSHDWFINLLKHNNFEMRMAIERITKQANL